jgi:hypothetical protein
LKVLLHHFSKVKKVKKKSQNSRNQGFSYHLCLMIEGSGSGSIPLTIGSGSRRPKKQEDPVDPDSDPQHCLEGPPGGGGADEAASRQLPFLAPPSRTLMKSKRDLALLSLAASCLARCTDFRASAHKSDCENTSVKNP